jgi:hypothetical protein
MPVPPPNSHVISLKDAAALTKRFRDSVPAGSIIAGMFNAQDIRRILDQAGCEGLRYYYGLDVSNTPVLVLVGVTADGNDMYNGELAEISILCPTDCADPNPLNTSV